MTTFIGRITNQFQTDSKMFAPCTALCATGVFIIAKACGKSTRESLLGSISALAGVSFGILTDAISDKKSKQYLAKALPGIGGILLTAFKRHQGLIENQETVAFILSFSIYTLFFLTHAMMSYRQESSRAR